MYQAYTQERMAEMHKVAATVFAQSDPKKASEFLRQCMDELFPEVATAKDLSIEAKQKELKAFSEKEIALVPMPGTKDGFRLEVSEKK